MISSIYVVLVAGIVAAVTAEAAASPGPQDGALSGYVAPPNIIDRTTLEATCSGAGAQYVLAVATGQHLKQVCPMLSSWALHSPNTHVVVFTDQPAVGAAVQASGGSASAVLLDAARVRPSSRYPWSNWRYHVYEAWLEVCSKKSAQAVAVMDADDVLVQGDIWKTRVVTSVVQTNSVMYTMEGSPGGKGTPGQVAGDAHNDLVDAAKLCLAGTPLGKEAQDQLTKEPVSNPGVVLGSAQAMLEYVRQMSEILRSNVTQACRESRQGELVAHMLLLSHFRSKGLLRFKLAVLPSGLSPVYHMEHGLPVELVSASTPATMSESSGSRHQTAASATAAGAAATQSSQQAGGKGPRRKAGKGGKPRRKEGKQKGGTAQTEAGAVEQRVGAAGRRAGRLLSAAAGADAASATGAGAPTAAGGPFSMAVVVTRGTWVFKPHLVHQTSANASVHAYAHLAYEPAEQCRIGWGVPQPKVLHGHQLQGQLVLACQVVAVVVLVAMVGGSVAKWWRQRGAGSALSAAAANAAAEPLIVAQRASGGGAEQGQLLGSGNVASGGDASSVTAAQRRR